MAAVFGHVVLHDFNTDRNTNHILDRKPLEHDRSCVGSLQAVVSATRGLEVAVDEIVEKYILAAWLDPSRCFVSIFARAQQRSQNSRRK